MSIAKRILIALAITFIGCLWENKRKIVRTYHHRKIGKKQTINKSSQCQYITFG